MGLNTNIGTLVVSGVATVSVDVVSSGDVTNTVTATGEDPNGDPVDPPTDDAEVDEINPSIQIVKDPATQQVVTGTDATFTITVTNSGDVALSNVTVTDALAPNCDISGVNLAVGATTTSYVCTVTNVTARLHEYGECGGHAAGWQ